MRVWSLDVVLSCRCTTLQPHRVNFKYCFIFIHSKENTGIQIGEFVLNSVIRLAFRQRSDVN